MSEVVTQAMPVRRGRPSRLSREMILAEALAVLTATPLQRIFAEPGGEACQCHGDVAVHLFPES